MADQQDGDTALDGAELRQALRAGLRGVLERTLAAATAAIEDVQKAESGVEGSARCGECQALLSVDAKGRIKAHKPMNAQGESKDCPGSNRFGKVLGGPDAPVTKVTDGAHVGDAKVEKNEDGADLSMGELDKNIPSAAKAMRLTAAARKAKPAPATPPPATQPVAKNIPSAATAMRRTAAERRAKAAPAPTPAPAPVTKSDKEPNIVGEITTDGGIHRRAEPRIVGAKNVERFKAKIGACSTPGCVKIAGHEDGHPAQKTELAKVTPPGISEATAHRIKHEYPGEKSKAYATMWSIHNRMSKSDTWSPDSSGKVRGSVLERQRGAKPAGKSPAAVRGVTPEQMANPMAKAGPPPIPPAAVRHPGASAEGLPLAGTNIPPRVPGSALGGKLAPTKLPGMPGRVGGAPAPELMPVTTPRPARASTMSSVKVPGLHRAEPPAQTGADKAAVAGANKQLGGFKSLASSPTKMPGGAMGKAEGRRGAGVAHGTTTDPKGTHECPGCSFEHVPNEGATQEDHYEGCRIGDKLPKGKVSPMRKGELCKKCSAPMAKSHSCP